MRKVASLWVGLVIAMGMLGVGCGSDDGPPAWFHEPSAPAVDPELEQASHLLTVGHQNFGATTLGENYECHGSTCICDNTAGPILAEVLGPDCIDLQVHECAGGELTCTDGGLGREVCICTKTCFGQPPSCILASGVIASGLYSIAGTGTVFRRLNGYDRTCTLTSQQWAQGGSVRPTALSGDQADNMLATIASTTGVAQGCSGVEAGLQTNTLADKHYRAPDGTIYKKSGMRACAETWTFYSVSEGAPTFTQMDAAGTADFLKRYAAPSGALLCQTRDI